MNNSDILGEVAKFLNKKDRASLANIGPHTRHLMPNLNKFEKLWYNIFKRGFKPTDSIWIGAGNAYIIIKNRSKILAEIEGSADDNDMLQMFSIFESVLKKHGVNKKRSGHTPHTYTLTLNKGSESDIEIAFAELFVRCYNTFRERLSVAVLFLRDKNGTKPFPEFMDVLKEVAPMPMYSVPLARSVNRSAPAPISPARNDAPPPPRRTSTLTQRQRIMTEADSLPTSAAQALLRHGKLDESVRVRRAKNQAKLAEAGPTPHLGGKLPQKSVRK